MFGIHARIPPFTRPKFRTVTQMILVTILGETAVELDSPAEIQKDEKNVSAKLDLSAWIRCISPKWRDNNIYNKILMYLLK